MNPLLLIKNRMESYCVIDIYYKLSFVIKLSNISNINFFENGCNKKMSIIIEKSLQSAYYFVYMFVYINVYLL